MCYVGSYVLKSLFGAILITPPAASKVVPSSSVQAFLACSLSWTLSSIHVTFLIATVIEKLRCTSKSLMMIASSSKEVNQPLHDLQKIGSGKHKM